jgi:hypothetical protein
MVLGLGAGGAGVVLEQETKENNAIVATMAKDKVFLILTKIWGL